MSLPPVVSDPERCPDQRFGLLVVRGKTHVWYDAMTDDLGIDHRVCRYCGGRKP